MTTFSVDVPAAAETLSSTAGKLEDLPEHLEELDTGLQNAQTACGDGTSAPVIEALNNWWTESAEGHISKVTAGSSNAITFTGEALEHYWNGDEEMALEAEASANQVEPIDSVNGS